MKTLEEFKNAYNATLRLKLENLEARRETILKRRRSGRVLLSLPWIVVPLEMLLFAHVEISGVLYVFIALYLFVGAIWKDTLNSMKKMYKKAFQDYLVFGIGACLDEPLEYKSDRRISATTFMASQIFGRPPVKYRGGNYFSGKIGDTDIEFSEIRVKFENNEEFHGLFFVADFKKPFTEALVIHPSVVHPGIKGKPFERVVTAIQTLLVEMYGQHPVIGEFTKHFVVMSGDDPVQVRHLLSPDLMQRLVEFANTTERPLYLSCVHSKVFMAISCDKERFEPKLSKTTLDRTIQEIFEDLRLVLGIVEDLNANTSIWETPPPVFPVDEGLLNILERYRKQLEETAVYVYPFIPKRKLKEALEGYATRCSATEIPLVLFDVLPSSGRRGCLITDHGMYHQTEFGVKHFWFAELADAQLQVKLFNILADREQIFSYKLDWQYSESLIASMLRELIRYHSGAEEEAGTGTLSSSISDVARFVRVDPGIQAILSNYSRNLKRRGIYVGATKIPGEKLRKAVHRYAKDYSSEELPLVLIDTSLFGTGTVGAIVTNKHVYTRDPETGIFLKRAIAGLADFRIYGKHVIYAAGERLLDLGLPRKLTLGIARILQEMAAYYAGSTGEKQERIRMSEKLCTVIVTFGNVSLQEDEGMFLFANPDFERQDHPIDVSEVYIDPLTCDPLLLERFITYIVNYPPKHGVQSVKIFYQGKLDDLGENLKNALGNNFEYIEKIAP